MAYKILFVTDLHGNKEVYERLVDFANKEKEIQAVVIGGDLSAASKGAMEEGVRIEKEFLVDFMIPELKKCSKDIYLMMGNDDFKVNMEVLEKESKKGTFKLMHNKVNKLGKWNIVGYSFVTQMPFLMKDWEKMDDSDSKAMTDAKQEIRSVPKEKGTIKEDMAKLKKLSNPKKTIYVMHAPPFDTYLDRIYEKRHVGSKSIREFIENEQPFLTLHGHIHESVTMSGEFADKIGSTVCANPGSEYHDGILNAVIIDLENLEDMEHEMI
ncbi:MAG: metallophosphoesterase [Candidatus Woesearchaeota archaeon]|jgi:Icc-related predicted phosphoesterase|nr:metallophosphoesterase [Candidatus Woesearchaeota archaeon]